MRRRSLIVILVLAITLLVVWRAWVFLSAPVAVDVRTQEYVGEVLSMNRVGKYVDVSSVTVKRVDGSVAEVPRNGLRIYESRLVYYLR